MPNEKSIRILHLSDLHISEELVEEADKEFRIPHRYGHSVLAFLALDRIVNDLDWDILVISGDITRVGNRNSFVWARNWIENTISLGASEIGLALNQKGKPYIIIPGNHDRFNGKLMQDELANYNAEFFEVKGGHVTPCDIKGVTVNFHLFDSSTNGGEFGYGKIDSKDMIPKKINEDSVDIAVLHHHLMGPLTDHVKIGSELINYVDVLSYFLGCKYNAILFGHTHKHYIDYLYPNLITKQLPKRKRGRIWRRILERYLLRNLLSYENISYTREQTKEGQFPTVSKYYEYLYIKNTLKQPIKGPATFNSINQFYNQLDTYGERFKGELAKVKTTRVLISMASSACQFESEQKGFNVIEFIFEDGANTIIKLESYEYNGNVFEHTNTSRFRTEKGSTSLK